MELFEVMDKRRSCRNYTGKPFSSEKLQEITNVISELTPLYPEIKLEWRFAENMKGPFKVDAPHYLIISGHGNEGEAENAGFIFQQLMLWLNSQGIGSVWLGGPEDVQKNLQGQDLIAIAFGEPKGAIRRKLSEFKRKPISEITNDPTNPCIQAVHLAPSGMNLQPWYFEKTDAGVLVHKQNLKLPLSLFYKLTEVDLGIALCHYALACKQEGNSFTFEKLEAEELKKGYQVFGRIT